MKLSVALCSYNGAKYIEEQIDSILNQTMPVYEIVVCDDGSTDDTMQIVECLQADSSVSIRIFKNQDKLGVGPNFQKAVDLCQGDIVLFSDQDDVWTPQKTTIIAEYFESHPDVNVVFTDADLIDGDGNPLQLTPSNLWGYHFAPKYKNWFDNGLQLDCFVSGNVHATGATMAFRKSFSNNHPFESLANHGEVLHDFALALFAAEDNSLGYISQPLIKYRLHDGQTCGLIEQDGNVDYQIYLIDICILPYLHNKRAVEETSFARYRLRQTRRVLGCISMLLKLGKYRSVYGKSTGMVLQSDFRKWMVQMKKRIYHK